MSTEADTQSRLGEPKQVAEAAVTAYKRRSYLGRHPLAALLVFGVSPVVSLVALMALGFLPLGACEELGHHYLASLRQFEPFASAIVPYLMSLWTVVIPCILAAILYCRLARRLGVGQRWALLSCVTLALLVAMLSCSARISALPGKSALMYGIWNPCDFLSITKLGWFVRWVFFSPRQLIQLLVPLAIGWWFIRRNRDQDKLQLAS